MRQVETQWWTMPLPDEWQAEMDEDTVVITDVDGIGVLEITTLKKEQGEVEPAELDQFSAELKSAGYKPGNVKLGCFVGQLFEYEEEDQWCRDWFLARDEVLLLVSYTCLQEDRGLDDAAVEELVSFIDLLAPD